MSELLVSYLRGGKRLRAQIEGLILCKCMGSVFTGGKPHYMSVEVGR